MSLAKDGGLGKLVIKEDLTCLKYTKPADFIKRLVEILGVELQNSEGADFVVVGHATPTEEDKGRPWFRFAKNGPFQGIYAFQKGKWVRVFNLRNDQVVWMYGDSREIPAGFELIDSVTSGIPADVRTHIVNQYLVDTTISSSTVYKYFAVRWRGL